MDGMNLHNIMAMLEGTPPGFLSNYDSYYNKFRTAQDYNRLAYGAPENWKNDETLLMKLISGGTSWL